MHRDRVTTPEVASPLPGFISQGDFFATPDLGIKTVEK